MTKNNKTTMMTQETIQSGEVDIADKKMVVEKQRKPVIERVIYFNEMEGDHHNAKGRIVCVVYNFDRTNKVLKYGASIYKRGYDETDDARYPAYNKKCHKETANARLIKRPVIIDNVQDDGSLNDFNEKIRNYVYKKGVKGDRLNKIKLNQVSPIII
jgi:hypothetical protein